MCFETSYSYPSKITNFEFKHEETFALSDADGQDYDYDAAADDADLPHVRKRRSAQWAPDYDLYSRWAEEYYEDESLDKSAGAAEKPKEDLLDRLMSRNRTEEELQSEREWHMKKKDRIMKAVLYGCWALGVLILTCVFRVYLKRLLGICGCDFCDVFRFRRKMRRVVGNFTPGVYVHENGEKEYYPPTEEEIKALKDMRKLLFSLH
ncbi:hypothetical protein JTE90_024558 [Oedothorax gibbosus]|uniref:Uncharacterized protein n=1 Tax=Oedothorax gibbosus TaxID=931172 RepID=A0AAV6VCI0_9ARAC|nr:hypothetical protein JTE90_024558 [Oedothorax gibbosus]